ncbi:MAG TPA: hypothetical protein VFQ23_23845 [Anaerolineales bacterium]|nr:hypothetical protein [Anaerolineales bacterium]
MDEHSPIEERLPYKTRPLFFPNGASVEEFIIPDEDREIVLEQLYPFSPIPKLTDVLYDLHADKTFVVKDFRVTWEHGMNYLVSPYYSEGGGTVIDWVDEDWANEDGEDDDFDEDMDDKEGGSLF